MNSRRLLYIVLALGALSVLGAQASFFGADEVSRDMQKRDREIEKMMSGPAGEMIRTQAKASCEAEGGDDRTCNCMVREMDKIVKQSKDWGRGAAAEKRFKVAGNKARDKCGLPPLD